MDHMKRFEWKFWKVNPDLGLHQHSAFWFPVLFFLFLGILLSFPMWCLCIPDVKDYELIMKRASLPIFVSSLAIPFGVMIGRFHGSAQRKKANLLMDSNMSFNHFYDHRKHFFDYLEQNYKLEEPYGKAIEINQKGNLYKVIFPANRPDRNDFTTPVNDFKANIEKISRKIQLVIDEFNAQKKGTETLSYEDSAKFIDDLLKPFGFTIKSSFSEAFSQHNSKSPLEFTVECIKEGIKQGFSFNELTSYRDLGWHFLISIEECFAGYKDNHDALAIDAKLRESIQKGSFAFSC